MSIKEERNLSLYRGYENKIKELGSTARLMSMRSVINMLINSSAEKYYISLERAVEAVTLCEKGKIHNVANKNTRKMYQSIYEKYLEKRKDVDLKWCYKYQVVDIVINSTAPSYFMDIENAMIVIYTALKNRRKKCVH